jgi:hypothetical protein
MKKEHKYILLGAMALVVIVFLMMEAISLDLLVDDSFTDENIQINDVDWEDFVKTDLQCENAKRNAQTYGLLSYYYVEYQVRVPKLKPNTYVFCGVDTDPSKISFLSAKNFNGSFPVKESGSSVNVFENIMLYACCKLSSNPERKYCKKELLFALCDDEGNLIKRN